MYLFQSFQCPCHEISFGSVSDVLTVSSIQGSPQSADEESVCSSHVSNFDVGHGESFKEENDENKVINFTFLLS